MVLALVAVNRSFPNTRAVGSEVIAGSAVAVGEPDHSLGVDAVGLRYPSGAGPEATGVEDHPVLVPRDQSSEYFRKPEGGSFSDLQTFGYSRRHAFSPNGAGGAAILFGSPASGEMVSGQRVNEC
jgi:hypothetical protein